MHILILGAGPSGLAAALALAKRSAPDRAGGSPLTITILELRPTVYCQPRKVRIDSDAASSRLGALLGGHATSPTMLYSTASPLVTSYGASHRETACTVYRSERGNA